MNAIIDFFVEFFARLFSKTPKFQRQVRNILLTISALATFVLSLQGQGVELPTWLNHLFNWYSIFGAGVGALVAQLSVIWFEDNGEPINDHTISERLIGGGIKNPKK